MSPVSKMVVVRALQSPESSCVSANDYWETGGESEGPGMCPDLDNSHEERRLSERSFPRAYPQSSRRNRRRTKKRHHSHSPQVRRLQTFHLMCTVTHLVVSLAFVTQLSCRVQCTGFLSYQVGVCIVSHNCY